MESTGYQSSSYTFTLFIMDYEIDPDAIDGTPSMEAWLNYTD